MLNVVRCELKDKARKLFIDFSGGLDSKAVLFTLQEALGRNVDITAVNVYNKYNPASNELLHAWKIAEACEVNLLAFENSCKPSFSLYGNLAVKPFVHSYLLATLWLGVISAMIFFRKNFKNFLQRASLALIGSGIMGT